MIGSDRALRDVNFHVRAGDNTSVVFLIEHSHGLPKVARDMTSDRRFDALQRSVSCCVDWYYPIEALQIPHMHGLVALPWFCIDVLKLFTFSRLNSRALGQLFVSAKVCASLSWDSAMYGRRRRPATRPGSAFYLYTWPQVQAIQGLQESPPLPVAQVATESRREDMDHSDDSTAFVEQ